jgi:uncharacterized protein (DUF1697 family)
VNKTVALLRGINVGGKAVAMTDLEAAFVALGYANVRLYIRTGNVIFATERNPGPRLVEEIERQLRADLGHDITVILRTPDELERLVAGNPFISGGAEPSKLHVTFLSEKPEASLVAGIDPNFAVPDEFKVVGADVYLHCPDGYERSRLANAFWERRLRIAATTRNWNTVQKLLELSTAD